MFVLIIVDLSLSYFPFFSSSIVYRYILSYSISFVFITSQGQLLIRLFVIFLVTIITPNDSVGFYTFESTRNKFRVVGRQCAFRWWVGVGVRKEWGGAGIIFWKAACVFVVPFELPGAQGALLMINAPGGNKFHYWFEIISFCLRWVTRYQKELI